MKQCWDCKAEKPLGDFYNNILGKDGKQDRCKPCCKAYAAAKYLLNKGRILKKNKEWRKNNPEKMATIRKTWQQNNPDKLLEYDRRWKADNHDLMRERDRDRYDPEKAKIKNAAYREESPEIIAAGKKRWMQEHPEKAQEYNAGRRARLVDAPVNDFKAHEWDFLQSLYGHCCAYCGESSQRLSQDHVIALAEGGSNTFSNILPACKRCNSAKHATRFIIPHLLRTADGIDRPPTAFVPQWRSPILATSPSVPSVPTNTQLPLF